MDIIRRRGANLHLLLFCLLFLVSVVTADEDDDKKLEPKWRKREFPNQLTPFQFFEDSEVVLVTDPHDGKLYRSEDAGWEWEEVDDIPGDQAVQVFMPPPTASKEHAVLLGRRTTHWITSDRGRKWRKFTTDKPPSPGMPLSFHATDPEKIILNTGLDWTREAVYTTSGFKDEVNEPRVLRSKTLQCVWAKEKAQFDSDDKHVNENRILCIVQGPRSPHPSAQRLVYSDKYFKNDRDEIWPALEDGRQLAGVVSMVGATKYLLAARRSDRTSELAMYSSRDGAKWGRAFFGQQKLEADGFTIMEGTDHSVQVDVLQTGSGLFRAPPMGKLYTSDSNGTYFSQSEDYTNRNDIGYVDFEALEVVQGVMLTNIVSNGKEVLDRDEKKRVKSRISFDDGRTFHPLKTEDDKELHLHSYTQLRNQGKVFSSKAPGLVMGIGNEGGVLEKYDEGSLWVSSDGGETWYAGREGGHKYEFGDSGAVLMAVFDEHPGRHVIYSYNFGRDWKGLELEDADNEFRPQMLTTIPDSTSKKFVMQASSGRATNAKHWVYAFDFNAADLRKCEDKDFEKWHARVNKDGEPGCVMGRTQTFRRRKPDAQCFVDKEFAEPQSEFKDCECSDADFECDYGFARSENGERCEPIDKILPPKSECRDPDGKFRGPSGFRKIPGNTCERTKGKQLDDKVERPCAGTGDDDVSSGKISSTITLFRTQGFSEYFYLERGDSSSASDETIVMTDDRQRLWVSRDHGKEWEEQDIEDDIMAIYPNKFDRSYVYFITPSSKVYYSNDRMETHIKHFEAPGPPNAARLPVLRFHETEANWLIWTTCDDFDARACDPKAYVNRKEGSDKSWEVLINEAGSCEFVYHEGEGRTSNKNKKRVYCEKHDRHEDRERSRKSLVWSDDWFDSRETPFDDIVTFATMSEFIIVATRDAEDRSNLQINSSVDAEVFAPAKFPQKLPVTHHDGYTALDSSTHSIFLHATVNGRPDQEYGSIIKSNSNGTSFVMSLESVNRNSEGYVDFEKLLGIEGAAVANVVSNPKEVNQGKMKQRKTLMTHNDGADWSLITPPEHDRENHKYDCVKERKKLEECSLHLHGYTERKNPSDSYSSPTAIGLMMGIGNVGETLGPLREGDTFMSTNGGIDWFNAQNGQYMWEFGDQGSIIVLVRGGTPTNKVVYSLDEGANWTDYRFGDEEIEEIEVADITTVPSDGSRNFILWGTTTDSRKRAVTVNLDFSGVLDKRCDFPEDGKASEESDYYLWTPTHPKQTGRDKDCLFGHVAEFWRKKVGQKCYNGVMPDKMMSKKDCQCSNRDFEW